MPLELSFSLPWIAASCPGFMMQWSSEFNFPWAQPRAEQTASVRPCSKSTARFSHSVCLISSNLSLALNGGPPEPFCLDTIALKKSKHCKGGDSSSVIKFSSNCFMFTNCPLNQRILPPSSICQSRQPSPFCSRL